MVSASDDASIIVWDISDQEVKQDQFVRAHTNAINHIAFDGAGKHLSSCSSDLTIKIWKFDNPLKCLKTLSGHEHSVSCTIFTRDGNFLYSASRDKTIRFWEISSGFCKSTFKGHEEWVRYIDLNEKGNMLCSCSDDESIIIWSDKGEQKIQFSGHGNKIEKVIFVNNDNAKGNILTGEFGEKEDPESQADVLNKKILDTQKLNQKTDKEYVISASRDKTIKLFDITNSSCLYTFEGHDNWVRNILIHPSGKYLVSTGDDRSIRVWELKNGRCVKKLEKLHEKFIVSLAIHGDLNLLVTGGNDLCIKLWDCK